MIFVTVGSQLPFDRMVRTVEQWAVAHGRADDVFYQVGDGEPPKTGTAVRTMDPEAYRERFISADLVIGHAGTGTWMMAAEYGRKLILFPRRFQIHHEHRNEHQLDMCRRVQPGGHVTIAFDEAELTDLLDHPENVRVPILHSSTSSQLVTAVRDWLEEQNRAMDANPRAFGESRRVLAVSSGGGHWHELLCLRPAFEPFDVHYASIDDGYAPGVAPRPFHVVPDCNFNQPWRSWKTYRRLRALIREIKPRLIVSTGAAPGGFAMLAGRRAGTRTLWVDSAANGQVLSRSGRMALRIATTVFTQWPELAKPDGPYFRGGLLQ